MRFAKKTLGGFLLLGMGFWAFNKTGAWVASGADVVTNLGHCSRVIVREVGGPVTVKLTVVVFESEQCSLRILSQQKLHGAKSAEDMIGEGLAICNGGYYGLNTEGFYPCGLEIGDVR